MTDAADIQSPRSRWGVRAITWTIALIIIALVVRALVKQFQEVDWSQVHFHLLPALATVVCVAGVAMMQLVARWSLLLAYGYRLPWRVQMSAVWVPQMGKYVPGGIASIGGAVYLLRKQGVPGGVGLSVAVLLDALAVLAGLIVSAPLLFSREVRANWPNLWIAGLAMIVIGLIMLHPRIFVSLLNVMLRKLRRQPITLVPPLSRYLVPVLASFGQWICAGLGLWFMTWTIKEIAIDQIPLFIASAALAMTVSYLIPFSPGGLGVREGIYVATLKTVIGPEVAIVAVAIRVIQTVIEVVLAATGMWLISSSKQK